MLDRKRTRRNFKSQAEVYLVSYTLSQHFSSFPSHSFCNWHCYNTTGLQRIQLQTIKEMLALQLSNAKICTYHESAHWILYLKRLLRIKKIQFISEEVLQIVFNFYCFITSQERSTKHWRLNGIIKCVKILTRTWSCKMLNNDEKTIYF